MPKGSMTNRDPEAIPAVTTRGLRGARLAPFVAALALGLALSACDKCFDFPWQTRPGVCKSGQTPN
jgi:hypothetical protein